MPFLSDRLPIDDGLVTMGRTSTLEPLSGGDF
jgi:hypothetical protein